MTIQTIVRSSAAALLFAASSLTVGCADAEATDGDRVGRAAQPVIGGTRSTADQDAVVFVALLEGGQHAGTCTGTLVAPNLVLTALHCVAKTDEGALCGADGAAVEGGKVYGTNGPSSFAIVSGASIEGDLPKSRVAGVKKVITSGSDTMCNADIAMLVLDRDMPNAKVAPIRLDRTVERGELVTSVGWGLTEDGQSPSRRMTRSGIPVLAVGPVEGVGPSEFLVGESVCSGDSGGPAIVASGAVAGVVSRGGNGKARDPENAASTCVGAQVVYTSLAPFKTMIMGAFADAGATPILEGEAPRSTPPSATEEPVAAEEPAPSEEEEAAKPRTVTTTTHGCSSSPLSAKNAGEGAFALALLLVVMLARRGRAAAG